MTNTSLQGITKRKMTKNVADRVFKLKGQYVEMNGNFIQLSNLNADGKQRSKL